VDAIDKHMHQRELPLTPTPTPTLIPVDVSDFGSDDQEDIHALTAWLDDQLFGPDSNLNEVEDGETTLALIAELDARMAETPVKATIPPKNRKRPGAAAKLTEEERGLGKLIELPEEEHEELYLNKPEFYSELKDIEEGKAQEESIHALTAWLDDRLFGPDSEMNEVEDGETTLALIAEIDARLAENSGDDDSAEGDEDSEMEESEGEDDSPEFASPAPKKRRRDQEESDEEEVQRALALAKRPKLQPSTPTGNLISSLAAQPGELMGSAKAFKQRMTDKAKRIAERARGTAATARRRLMNPTEQDLAEMALALEGWKDTFRSMRGYFRI
jgi:molybdopterin converting factor small subunit